MKNKKEKLQELLREGYLGEIPLYFTEIEVNDYTMPDELTQFIEVEEFFTNLYETNPYRKPISRLV